MKFLKWLIIFVIIIAIIVLILGIIFPGLLWKKDLGIKYTDEDYASMQNKIDTINAINIANKQKTEEKLASEEINASKQKIEEEFTSKEITAYLNKKNTASLGLKDIQVKINSDNTISIAGTTNIDSLLKDVLNDKYSKKQLEEKIPALSYAPQNINVELNFEGSVKDNKSNIEVNKIAVQGIELPSSIIDYNDVKSAIVKEIDKSIEKYSNSSGAKVGSISVENNKILLKEEI